MNPIRVVQYGLGPIGQAACKLALTRKNLQVVGAVDIDPAKQGKDLGELLGLGRKTGVVVSGDAAAVFAATRPDVAIHCTSSFLPNITDQLVQILGAGVDVVSSSEELLLPDLQHADLAKRVAQAAENGGATAVGTGVNPGFVMDFVPIVASAVCFDVRSVRCVRVVDAGTRRLPLQKKVGAGLTVAQFEAELATGRFGHIGIRESVAMIGRALALDLDGISHTVEPVLAREERKTRFLTVAKGQVAGIRNIGLGKRRGETVVELDLSMYVGAPDPRDEVHLAGEPSLKLVFEGGVPGDQATAAILVNTIPQVVAAPPGLKTILDIAPPRLLR
ncbi:MAG: dihydrodipicolinate reductase [Planctomycetes bacterium]|nr:dihydrodipicolinate reductase [Planctomycetota bacterium]